MTDDRINLAEYGQGIIDGFKITLRLIKGEPADGGQPYTGPLPPELVAYIDRALLRLGESS